MATPEVLLDSDKLLLFFESVETLGIPIDEDDIDCVIFLLNYKGVQFGYHFYFLHSLYSADLHSALGNLEESGFITRGSPIVLTGKGKSWIHTNLPNEASGLVRRRVQSYLRKLITVDEVDLFEMVYAIASRRV